MTLSQQFSAAASRRRFGERTTAYRLVNGEGDGLPGIAVDWFDGVAVLSLYRLLSSQEEAAIADALMQACGPRSLYLKRRPKEAKRSAVELSRVAPESPFRGEPVEALVVREEGLAFEIRPPNGLSVGLYLDSREARRFVREHAGGRTVLNCFAYTCGFGVAALAGGATRAVNVDLSRRALEWGRRNAELNALPEGRSDYLAGDVMEWLSRLRKRGEAFDLLVLDPPSFATSGKRPFSAARDYGRLLELAEKVVARGGLILASCNLTSLRRRELERTVLGALHGCGRPAKVLARLAAPAMDFPTRGEGPLKVLGVRLDAGAAGS
ncbi:MAG: class I SAM-dependent rRNA methyltransferase [Myxococcales bacterium]|nr:class I SAM-dependent rRNA methyltransferase [Myxococcales bacterium]